MKKTKSMLMGSIVKHPPPQTALFDGGIIIIYYENRTVDKLKGTVNKLKALTVLQSSS
jgi:hypothetical protein